MKVLLVNCYAPDDNDGMVAKVALDVLMARGHDVDVLELHNFNIFMSAEERTAYHSNEPIVSDDTKDSVSRLQTADAILFCYFTMVFSAPASLKGWMDRVFVPGVAFVFDDQRRLGPGLPNIHRVGTITTSPHGRITRMRARDTGRRTTTRTMRLICHRRCRTTFLSLPAPAGRSEADRIRRTLSRW